MLTAAVIAALHVVGGAGQPLSPELQAEVGRLEGHTVKIEKGTYEILDIAGEGAPRVGCIHKVRNELVLVGDGFQITLRGPLAVPRIAGPRYKVWVLGDATGNGVLMARRLGILAGPASCSDSVIPLATTP